MSAVALTVYGIFRLPLTLFESYNEQKQLADVVRNLREIPLDQWFVDCSKYQTNIYIDAIDQNFPTLIFESYNSNQKTLRIQGGAKTGTLYLDNQSTEAFEQIQKQCQERKIAYLPALQQAKLIGKLSLADDLLKISPLGAKGFLNESESNRLACKLLNKELHQVKNTPSNIYKPYRALMVVSQDNTLSMIEDEILPVAESLVCK